MIPASFLPMAWQVTLPSMRNIQKQEIAPAAGAQGSGETEFDLEVND